MWFSVIVVCLICVVLEGVSIRNKTGPSYWISRGVRRRKVKANGNKSPVTTYLSDESPIAIVKAGLFDGPTPEPAREVWTEGKAAWMKVVQGGEEAAKLS